jgi:hypothetical protein
MNLQYLIVEVKIYCYENKVIYHILNGRFLHLINGCIKHTYFRITFYESVSICLCNRQVLVGDHLLKSLFSVIFSIGSY